MYTKKIRDAEIYFFFFTNDFFFYFFRHKRKVQNFLPCKTPTRGVHLDPNGLGGHSVTYEDPDAHLGHRPLVMRHHHNIEVSYFIFINYDKLFLYILNCFIVCQKLFHI